MEIIRTARKLVSQGFEVFFVDYIQLIKNGIENEVQDISMSSSMLRGFSLKYNVPVIAAAQLNREPAKRSKAPNLSSPTFEARDPGAGRRHRHLRDPGRHAGRTAPALPPEQSVWRPVRVPPGATQQYVKKNRNGPIGKTDAMFWDKSINSFTLAAEDPAPPAQNPSTASHTAAVASTATASGRDA